MVPLLFIGAFVAVLVLLGFAGLAAERQPRVRGILRRIEPLTHSQRGRLGVWIARDARVPAPVRLLPITAFVYRVIPLDLIPDPIPRVGYVDDRVALALAVWCVARWAGPALEEHLARIEFVHAAGLARRADPLEGTPDEAERSGPA